MTRRPAAALCLTMLAVPALCQAEEPSRFALTALGGVRIGGEFENVDTAAKLDINEAASFGLKFNARASGNTQYEVFYNRQRTDVETSFVGGPSKIDLDIDYLQFGGTVEFDGDNARPYFGLTVGASRFAPRSSEFGDETYFAFSIGGGLDLLPASRVGVQFDARYYGTFVSSDSELFCRTGPEGNLCAVRVTGSVLSQFELSVGVQFRF